MGGCSSLRFAFWIARILDPIKNTPVKFSSIRQLPLPLAAIAALTLFLPPEAHSAEGGYSNYIPGTYGDFGMALEPPGRLTLRNDLYYYEANATRSLRSGRLEAGADLGFLVNLTTLLYKPGLEVFSGQYAFGAILPIVHVDLEASLGVGSTTIRAEDKTTGFGDLTLIPAILYWNHGNAHWSLGHYIVTPTGDYSTDALVNPGLNYWSFDTNVAFTWLHPERGHEISINLGHIYNTENNDTDYQTGQEIHLDVALNQYFTETFAVGLHGFYLNQITGDSGSGALLGGFRARASAIGPAILWSTRIGKQDISFIGKWLHEFDAENRMEGDHFFISFAMDW